MFLITFCILNLDVIQREEKRHSVALGKILLAELRAVLARRCQQVHVEPVFSFLLACGSQTCRTQVCILQTCSGHFLLKGLTQC